MKPIFIAFLLIGSVSFAQDKASTSNAKDTKKAASSADDFRCERYMTRDLSVLKQKLKEHCNLNKPFTASLSVFTGDDTYLYCCHTK